MKLIKICIVGMCILFMTGCGVRTSQPTVVTDHDNQPESYTVLIYMCGSDIETTDGAATDNIDEMLSANIPDNVNVLIQTGGALNWKKDEISANSTDRYLVTKGNLKRVDRDVCLQNFGDPKTLENFITYGVNHYPADHYALILWNHGGGTAGGICFDSNYGNDSLKLPELHEALLSANVQFDFIGMDACLMATYETASVLAGYADYFIASQEMENLDGWDYDTVLSKIGTSDYYDQILASYARRNNDKNNYTLSVIDLKKLSKITEIVENVAAVGENHQNTFSMAVCEGKSFGRTEQRENDSGCIDLGMLANKLNIDYDWKDCIKRVNGKRHEDASGISIYIPDDDRISIDDYQQISANDRMGRMLSSLYYYPPAYTIEYISGGYEEDNKLLFSLKEASLQYIKSIGYYLCYTDLLDDRLTYYEIGQNNNIEIQDNLFTVDFDGEWLAIDNILLHTEILEDTSNYTAFAASVKIENEECRLLINHNKTTGDLEVEGYIKSGKDTSRIYELEAGTEVTILYKKIDFSSNTYSTTEEGSIFWSENTRVHLKKLSVGNYQLIPIVVDIYDKEFLGSTVDYYFDGEKAEITHIAHG